MGYYSRLATFHCRTGAETLLIGGKVHKEIFTFAKATGKNKGKEWDNVVKPIIEKWGNFAETCL
jgi:hypothetical protein